MKKLLVLVSVFAVGLSVNSCKKMVDNENVAPMKIESNKAAFVLQDQYGNIVDASFAQNENCYVLTEEVKGEIKYTYFPSEEACLEFAKANGAKYAELVYKINFVRGARAVAEANGDYLLTGENPVYSDALLEYLKTFNSSQSKAAWVYYDGSNGSGATRVCQPYPIPNYFAFNNRMESYQVLGTGIAYEGKLFKGTGTSVIGVVQTQNHSDPNNMESSI